MRIVLRIGGSVVASPVSPDLISSYINLIRNLKIRGHDVAVVVGGGKLARELIKVAAYLGLDEQAQDEIAISVSRIFAQLFIKKLGKVGCDEIALTVEDVVKCLVEGKLAVLGGLKPGMTTDAVAALVAEKIDADLLVKATDQDGIYDKDPDKYSDAVKFDRLTFEDLSTVFPESKHKAGIHQIIDPEAIRILKRERIKMIVVDGFKLKNVLDAVQGRNVGTIIS